jgi:hypothetical protein
MNCERCELSPKQRRLEREAELAAREDSDGAPSSATWVALGLVLLAGGGFVTLLVLVVKLLRSCAVLP